MAANLRYHSRGNYKALGLIIAIKELFLQVRGEVNVAVGGGPDTLRAIYGRGLEDDGYHTNVAGDGLYYLVSWDSNGEQTVRGIHHFGSATLDEASPHFADQAAAYAREELRDPLFRADIRARYPVQRYRPGEEMTPAGIGDQ